MLCGPGGGFEHCVHVSSTMMRAAILLDIPVVVTEQYPEKLGATGGGCASARHVMLVPCLWASKCRLVLCLVKHQITYSTFGQWPKRPNTTGSIKYYG